MQDRSQACRDPSFAHFLARPYILGLQDMLFSCNEPVHDFYHVEPQHTCLEDESGKLAVDWLIRCARPAQRCFSVVNAMTIWFWVHLAAAQQQQCTHVPLQLTSTFAAPCVTCTGSLSQLSIACRVEQLQDDMDGLIESLNSQRLSGLPELDKHIGWDQKGPLAKDSSDDGNDSKNNNAKDNDLPDQHDGSDASSSDDDASDSDIEQAKGNKTVSDADDSVQGDSRHLQKFVKCGAKCFHHALKYYRKDFQLLQYPGASADL